MTDGVVSTTTQTKQPRFAAAHSASLATSTLRSSIAFVRPYFPRMQYRTSWIAGLVVIAGMTWMNTSYRCAKTGSREALFPAHPAAKVAPPLDTLPVQFRTIPLRYRYGWPWRLVMVEGSYEMVNRTPLTFVRHEFKIREVLWHRVAVTAIATLVVGYWASHAVDRARVAGGSFGGTLRRLSRFKLRTLWMTLTSIAIVLGYQIERDARQHAMVTEIKRMGGEVSFTSATDYMGAGSHFPPDSFLNRLRGRCVGAFGVGEVYGFGFFQSSVKPEQIRQYAHFGCIEGIGLGTTTVNAEVVDALNCHDSLCVISKIDMSERERDLLHGAFPDCYVLNVPSAGALSDFVQRK